jgi:Na+/H+-dicarboxylate symporter
MKLHWKILIGMGAGVVVGLLINESFFSLGPIGGWLNTIIGPALGPVGQVFIGLLKMLIVPLILASMVMGVANVGDIRKLGGIGARTLVYYIATTWASVIVGLLLVNLIRPGVGADGHGFLGHHSQHGAREPRGGDGENGYSPRHRFLPDSRSRAHDDEGTRPSVARLLSKSQ